MRTHARHARIPLLCCALTSPLPRPEYMQANAARLVTISNGRRLQQSTVVVVDNSAGVGVRIRYMHDMLDCGPPQQARSRVEKRHRRTLPVPPLHWQSYYPVYYAQPYYPWHYSW